MALEPAAVQSVVQRYFAAIRALNRDAWVALFSPNAELRDPAHAPPKRGHGELRDFFDLIAGLFSSIEIEPDEIYVCGDSTAVKWTWSGIGKNGASVGTHGIDVFEIGADGRIASVRGYWDPVPMLRQLGAA